MPPMTENDERKNNGKPDNEEIVIIEENPRAGDSRDNNDDDDRRLSNNDSGLQDDGNDVERAAIRERRRLEKLERKNRRGAAIDRDRLEMEFLRNRNDDLERRLGSVENHAHQTGISHIDAHIAQARNEAEMAERVIAKAVSAGNGDDVAQAMRYRDQAFARVNQLENSKHQAMAKRHQESQPKMDSATLKYAKEFIDENSSWYDPKGQDEDSAIVIAIDGALHREGFHPETEEYWDELRERAAKRLPERFKQTTRRNDHGEDDHRQQRQSRGGPAIGSGREHAPTSTRTEVYINPERKQALIDAGVWDDPVLRKRYVKQYAEYDRSKRS